MLTSAAGDVKGVEPAYWARTWQTDDGLPRNTITSIAQTSNHYLWLGTPFGLIRFDGVTFTHMEGDFFEGLTQARTRVLYTDDKGRLWIGTGTAGIIRYDGRSFTIIDGQDGLPHPTVTSICEDLAGNVWVGLQDGSLCWVDADDQVHILADFRADRAAGGVQLVRDVQGNLWFAHRGAFGRILEGAATNITVIPNSWIAVCPSRDGSMWFSAGEMLQKFSLSDPGRPVEKLRSPVNANQVPVLFEDHSGNLWIGSQREGVFRYTGRGFTRELDVSRRVHSIFQDAESNIWIGTEGGGLSRLRPKVFNTITTKEGLPQPVLLSVCETADGEIWFSGRGPMLMRWKEGHGLDSVTLFTNIGTTCIFPQTEGGIWAGTVDWGLFSVAGGEMGTTWMSDLPTPAARRVADNGALRNLQIRAIHRDRRGHLWLGCLPSGLFRLKEDILTTPWRLPDSSVPTDAIWAITDDQHTNIWAGTIKGELWRYDGAQFIRYGRNEGIPGAPIAALHVTQEGDLWIGTLGGGLGRLKRGRFAFADTRHGLADDVISGIADDGRGYFWLSSDRGIIRAKKSDLDDFADGNHDHVHAVHYGKDDGLANVECIGGYQPSSWRTRSGNIWFATTKGAVVVDPSSIPTNSGPPMLVLEQVLLDGSPVTNLHNLKLAHAFRRLEFHYSAPSFTSPEHISFRHQLVGLDADWISDGTTRFTSYPRLVPGKYEFRFSASNREGAWNDHPLVVPFEVIPAWWQTAWFRVAALIVFGGVVAGGVRYHYLQKLRRKMQKLAQAHAIEQERMRIARDLHDDLGARLTQMAFLGEMAAGEKGITKNLEDRLAKIADGSRQSIRSLEEIVWAVNPSKDSLPQFVDYLSHYANEFFRCTPTRCRQDLPLIIPDIPVATNLRHHLFLACKEALNNVSKHARAGVVWLRLVVTGPDLVIIIEDDGQGFTPPGDPGSAAGGNGLANMQNRIQNIRGNCEVDSTPGRGTRVRFHVRLPGAAIQRLSPEDQSSLRT